ncbi:MAG: Acyl-CoA dehydrogenase C-terminal domain-containing protein [Lentimicrobium sp.]|jgi:alkylation response protein AidB-like acyl-CoA dehydrogenase|nr:Acyl-CoA dehydrogenase C-terminal domain-containing protein [Lentimicrobium sp.]
MANFYNDNPNLKFHLNHPLMEKIVRLKERNYTEKEKHDYAALDLEDALDSYDKVLEIVGEISGDIIAPNAESVDHEGPQLIDNEVIYARGTSENYDALVKSGMIGMSLPREYGGLNFPMVPYVMAAEIVSRADAGFANIWGLQDCAETIHEFGSEEIKNEFLPRFNKGATAAMDLTEPDAGSDLQAVQLKATLDPQTGNWYLDGVKRFITNGDADISLVLARSEPNTSDARGLSLFVYDRTQKAVKIRRIENKLGIKGSPTCELVFKNAPAKLIGDTRMGLIKYVMSLMNSARLGVGAQSVGLAEAAWREALKYAQEREQFGKAIIKYPAVYEMITNMQVKTDAIRTLLYETARFVDVYKAYTFTGQERKLEPAEREEFKYYVKMADVFTPLLKLFSSEYCNQIAYDAIQIHGGTGYMKDFPVERIWRDARITTIYEGTSQLQVVAAIRGVGNGIYLKAMQTYHETAVKPELQYLKSVLEKMTDQFAKTVIKVNEFEDNEYLDYHARRLVEMAGNVIMGYLLLLDANRNSDYTKSADIFIRIARAENIAKVGYINQSHPKDLGTYKQV